MAPDELPAGSASERVLLIDDNEEIVTALCSYSYGGRYVLTGVTDPREGLKLALAGGFEALVVDAMMPHIAGAQIMAAARERDPFLPIVAITAFVDDPRVQLDCIQNGADFFLGKPFRFELLLQALDTLQERSRRARQRAAELAELSGSRPVLQATIDQLGDLVYLQEISGRIVSANRPVCDFLGRPREAVVGHEPGEFMPAWAARQDELDRRKVVETGREVQKEFSLESGGRLHHYWSKKFPLRDRAGNLWLLGGVVRDITTQRENERSLARSERYFRSLSENALDLFLVLDRQGRIRFANCAVERVLGHALPTFLGQEIFDYVHPGDLAGLSALFEKLLRAPGQTGTNQFRFQCRDRSWRHLELSGCNYLSEPNVAGLIFNCRDVSDRVWAEAELRQSRAELEVRVEQRTEELRQARDELQREIDDHHRTFQQLERNRCFVERLNEQLGEMIFLVDFPEGRIEYVNRAVRPILGFEPDEVLGRSGRDFYIDPRRFESDQADVVAACARGEVALNLPMQLKRKDGGALAAEVRLSIIPGDSPSERRLLGIVRPLE